LKVVIDASVVLKGFFADEEGHNEAQEIFKDYALGILSLSAPILLSYEITNGVLQALKRRRIEKMRAKEILKEFEALEIPLQIVGLEEILEIAQAYQRSAYDAAYLALAQKEGVEFITGDKRLYNAVKDRLPWVKWVENYQPVGKRGLKSRGINP